MRSWLRLKIAFQRLEYQHKAQEAYYNGFTLFHLPPQKDAPRFNAFNVLPTESEDLAEAFEWRLKMITWIAAGKNPITYEKLYYETDYIKVFEFYVLASAGNL